MAKERGLRGNPTCQHLDLGRPASRTVRKLIFVVGTSQCVRLCYGSRCPLMLHSGTVMCPEPTSNCPQTVVSNSDWILWVQNNAWEKG